MYGNTQLSVSVELLLCILTQGARQKGVDKKKHHSERRDYTFTLPGVRSQLGRKYHRTQSVVPDMDARERSMSVAGMQAPNVPVD